MSNVMVIVLGAGKPYRGEAPSAIVQTGQNKRVLDWIIEAFRNSMEAEFHFVGGYRLDEIMAKYPDIYFSANPSWEKSGSVGSLFSAPLTNGQDTYVCYADVVFRPTAVHELAKKNGDIVLAVDSEWLDRYEERTSDDMVLAEKVRLKKEEVNKVDAKLPVADADAEFTGLLKLSANAVNQIITMTDSEKRELASAGIPLLINALQEKGLIVNAVDIGSDWAELNEPQDMARFVLGTKAETLERLKPLVRKAIIGDQYRFTVQEWNRNNEQLLKNISSRFNGEELIVRSSSLAEDGWSSSKAGYFISVPSVPRNNKERVRKAIEKVITSYGDYEAEHQILIQEMLKDVAISGVVLTRTLSYGSPYYYFNYDDSGTSTESVTSGTGKNLKTVIVYRDRIKNTETLDKALEPIRESILEIEQLVGHDSLDIEFAMSKDGCVNIFQIRPIAVEHNDYCAADKEVETAIRNSVNTYNQRLKTTPFLLGKGGLFGVMTDWNPAEIIGIKPKRLALSLYEYLITDEVWAQQRAESGYRDVRPCPLLVNYSGHPYVDIRASFNSFIPAKIQDEMAQKLVQHYLDCLVEEPFLHDKVEFGIVFTCLTFDYADLVKKRLLPKGFTVKETEQLREALLDINNRVFSDIDSHIQQIGELERRYELVMQSDLESIDLAYTLLEDCRKYGTLPFAHLARAGFVAVSLLRSLETESIATADEVNGFLNSLNTITRRFEQDGADVADDKMKWESFVRSYGHLRPGTYEITSPSYAEEPELYLKPIVKDLSKNGREETSHIGWGTETKKEISKRLVDIGWNNGFSAFDKFLRKAIEYREYAKFAFTRNLSAALEAIKQYGDHIKVTREELSHIAITDLLNLRKGNPPCYITDWLKLRSNEGKEWHNLSQTIEIPPLIFSVNDFYEFELPESHPNYVTRKCVLGELIRLENAVTTPERLKDKIVMIPQADPGFDWLFGYKIMGLITMYGGANSHMTIRAAEMGLPAAIGVGELLYQQLKSNNYIELDCGSRHLRVIK